ncbi:MAG: pyridoxal-phosphate dependent enzyme, partial [Planctomycetota bacterium]
IPAGYATLIPRLAAQFLVPSHWHDARPPYYVPGGGTSPLACLGHVNAALELKQQIDAGLLTEPDYLYVALGSLGTAAGLAAGCRLAGLRTRLVGVVVSYRWYCTAGRWARLARRVHRLMQRYDRSVPDIAVDRAALTVVATSLGEGYARFTEAAAHLTQEMRDTENVELDGTYTAKTLDGALNFIDQRRLHHKTHLFWHTYQSVESAPDSGDAIASLPHALRRYFVEDTQPLDV